MAVGGEQKEGESQKAGEKVRAGGGQESVCDFTCILPHHSWEYSFLNVGDASGKLIYRCGSFTHQHAGKKGVL